MDPIGWVLYTIAAAAALAAALLLYGRMEAPGRGRRVLAVMRWAAVALLLLLIFDPRLPVLAVGGERETSAGLEPADHEFWTEVRRLPTRQAQALVLHYVEDMPVAEIAEVMGCATSTAKVHLHRGRRALAERLGLDDDGGER
jgi:DNA-directed RNA polymerase specialized sigma24 family protein